MYASSNPVLNDNDTFAKTYGKDMFMTKERSSVATLSGVVNKTALLILIAVTAGALAYAFITPSGGLLMVSAFAGFGICIAMGFMMRGNPKVATVMAPVYAVVEGAFLGLLTKLLDGMLVGVLGAEGLENLGLEVVNPKTKELEFIGTGVSASLALPAFLITIGVTLAMLGLFYTGLIKPTRRFQAIIGTAVIGIMFVYLLSWPLAMFGIEIPFLSLNSAMQGGTAGLIGLGISVLILGIASLTLIIDFGRVQEIVQTGQPKYMEWYAGFGLLVTLAWIYYEAVKLSFRLALLFANRD